MSHAVSLGYYRTKGFRDGFLDEMESQPKLLNNASTVFTTSFATSLPYRVNQSASQKIGHTETQCCAANDSSRIKLLPQRLFPPSGQHEV